jgi:hypothetical protein
LKNRLIALALLASCIEGVVLSAQAGTSNQDQQIAHLNHFYAYVDVKTAEAIRTSAFLRQFAEVAVNTTTANGETYTARYLRGRETYAEFFAVGDSARSSARVGTFGVAVSGDTPGVVRALEQRLKASGLATSSMMRTRRFGDREVDWFHNLAIRAPDGAAVPPNDLFIWAMEYVPAYFEVPEAAKEAAEGPEDVVSRERYQSDKYQEHMMRDIAAINVAVTRDDFARAEPLLIAAGFRLTRDAAGATADGVEADLSFQFVPRDGIGLRSVEFLLNRVAPRVQTETIGNSTLTVGPGNRARWVFPATDTN